ncbi:MAG: carboxymuconolactone decarboxylase family protein [Candidatus Hydrogenedentes bacterium]|nr:carboxymuconolactone decarboxylase family protein [Candidatus Hydrogenedentota bacterium]
MRLAPIEQPKTLMLRLAYWMTRRAYGRVITPLKVVYARMPKSLGMSRAIVNFAQNGLRLDKGLVALINTHVASINGCGFCVDIAQAHSVFAHVPPEKMRALPNYATSELYTERERAALAYVEEVTKTKNVSDETFAELKMHFSEEEIVEITWVNAMENYYNLINRPLGIESDGLCMLAEKKVGR